MEWCHGLARRGFDCNAGTVENHPDDIQIDKRNAGKNQANHK
jgi:hypothetical protein